MKHRRYHETVQRETTAQGSAMLRTASARLLRARTPSSFLVLSERGLAAVTGKIGEPWFAMRNITKVMPGLMLV